MSVSCDRPFWDMDDAEITALVLAPQFGSAVPSAYLVGVSENLRVLRGHAQIVAEALAATSAAAAPGEVFEP